MSRLKNIGAMLAVAFVLSGCVLFQKKEDLDKVHQTYRSEFAATFLIDTKGDGGVCGAKLSAATTSFPNTLQAIRDYEVTYRNDDSAKTEKGHLTILKAMIHLQVGNTGIAGSMADAVRNAPLAASDDREVRDTLFQQAFPYLVKGWQAACDLLKAKPGGTYGFTEPQATAYTSNLTDAGKGVIGVAKPELVRGLMTDQGTIYLATSGAIFNFYAYRVGLDSCRIERLGDVTHLKTCMTQAESKGLIKAGANAIAAFLSEDEKKAATSESTAADWLKVVPVERQQYVRWYWYLASGEAEKEASK